jgi:hypothetical protein
MMQPNYGQSEEPRKIKSALRNRNHFKKTATKIELDGSGRVTGKKEAA